MDVLSRAPFLSIESNKPKKNYLSRNLIALLSHGEVPKEYFLDILTNALEDAQCVCSNKRAALKVAINHGEMDDDFIVARMILSRELNNISRVGVCFLWNACL
ncbi:hypothetical protein HYC85_013097 [Camellia sinensis]|uniref:RNA-dependent RNA polymerase n=1 Tax=Camellia sinensis TaxID=4442 RepID=A0A7J7HGL4_CAMSI|nr:hypothetical protein HYC85_013097 [Camellia sinensis]